MADLMHYPSEDLEAPKQAHIGNKPYVKFTKTFMHNIFDKDTGASYSEPRDETHYYPLGSAPNVEALVNMQHNGCKFVGYGNLPRSPQYGEIATWLKNSTAMAYTNEDSAEYKALEAKILAKAERGAVEAATDPAPKETKGKGKKADAEVDPVNVPEGL